MMASRLNDGFSNQLICFSIRHRIQTVFLSEAMNAVWYDRSGHTMVPAKGGVTLSSDVMNLRTITSPMPMAPPLTEWVMKQTHHIQRAKSR